MTSTAEPFEGVEKRIIIQFRQHFLKKSLREILLEQWQDLLDYAGCQILSSIQTNICTAYLLSESSLFVYNSRVILKTCGTTTPLLFVPQLIQLIFKLNNIIPRTDNFESNIHLELLNSNHCIISWMLFTHINYCFPEKQKCPHRSFFEEYQYITSICPASSVSKCILKTSPEKSSKEFFLCGYISSELNSLEKKKLATVKINELIMFGIDPNCVEIFSGIGIESRKIKNTGFDYKHTHLDKIFQTNKQKKIYLDEYWFNPCGYSCNALTTSKDRLRKNQNKVSVAGLFTTHISPELESSYASVEWTDVNLNKKHSVMYASLMSFKPQIMYTIQVYINYKKSKKITPLYIPKSYQVVGIKQIFKSHWFSVMLIEYCNCLNFFSSTL